MKNFRKHYCVFIFAFLPLIAVSQIDFDSVTKEEIEDLKNSEADKLKYWLTLAEEGIIPFNPTIPVKAAEYRISKDGSKSLDNMSTDICVLTETGNTQSENSIFIDPNDDQYALNSNNSYGPNFYGSNYIQTTDGGLTWNGSKFGAAGSQSGDPAACIGTNGREYVGFIDNNDGQGIAYSDNGTSWTYVSVVGDPGIAGFADKNHLMINNVGGSYNGYIYDAWYHLANNNAEKETVISRSTNNGVSWSTPVAISTGVNAGHHNQGVNIQIGPNGQVYVVWAIYDNWGPTTEDYREDALGFARSTNGGASYYTAIKCVSNIMGIRHSSSTWASNVTGKSMRVNSFPSMAVDVSGGPRNGYIYVVWANLGTPGINTGTNVSIYMIRSTNGGISWSSPIKVNQGSFTNDKAAYLPWITCDPENGRLYCIFYDDRNFSTSSADVETWVAYSEDGGITWDDFVVSDVSFTPSAIPGTAGGYMGDYLGIAAQNNYVYPTWTDNRTGTALTYVSPLHFSDACIAMGGCDEYISNVSIGSINNSSDCEGYTNFTNLSTNMPVNGSETVTVTIGGAYSSDDITVWVDWNRDDDFDDANELEGYATGIGPHEITITPPADATMGECTVRIRLSWSGTPPGSPCGQTSYGEVEDYTLNLTTPAPNYWTGAYNYYWHNDLNWSLGHIPTAIETVYMTTDGYYPPAVDYFDDECNNLIIEAGAGLDIADQTLTIHNDLTVFGNLTMSNTASKCYIHHDVLWKAGSTGSMTGSARMYVYEDWNFEAGANVQFAAGYVEFVGSNSSFIRSYDADCEFNNVLSNKSTYCVYSELSSEDLHISGNLYNNTSGNGSIFRCNSEHSLILGGFFNNLNNGHFECIDGTFEFNGNPSTIGVKPNTGDYFNNLVINTTSALNLDPTYTSELMVNGNVTIQGGTLNAGDFNITVGEDWTNSGGVFNAETSTVIFSSTGVDNDVYGTETFYNVEQVNTGKYLRFNGPTTINNNLLLTYFSWAYNTFNVNGTLNIDAPGSKFTANGANANATIATLNQGGTIFSNADGSITINDLFESYILGTYHANDPGCVINISNNGSFVDLGGNLIVNGGTINISGSFCYWPYSNDASVTMTSGVIDVMGCDIYISNTSVYTLTDNITGGIIRTDHGFSGNRADFAPTLGTFEFYGTSDNYLSQSNGCTIPNVVIDKTASEKDINFPPIIKSDDGRISKEYNNSSGGAKSNNISLNSDFVITNNLDIISGSLTLNGNTMSVNGSSSVYGTLTMNDASDVFYAGSNYFHQLNFFSGSTADFTNGNIYIYGWIIPRAGCSFNLSTNNTVIFAGNSGGGPSNFEPTATYGNITIHKNANQRTYIDNSATEPIEVNGNFTIYPNNEFELQDETFIVHGISNDDISSKIYTYDVAKDFSALKSTSLKEEETVLVESEYDIEPDLDSKGGYLEFDNDFTLNGLLDIGDGNVLQHGHYTQASTGMLNILNNGTFICDEPTSSGCSVLGTFNMNSGLFEISNNHLQLLASCNISGGTIRSGGTFNANADGNFQPTGGSVELIGNGSTGEYIQVHLNNYFYDLTINRTNLIQIYTGYDLDIKNDFTIISGGLNTNTRDMYVGGDWDNQAGIAAFVESTGKVSFNGPDPAMQYIYSDEYFNILENNTNQAIRINSANDEVECNIYNWISGGISVAQGTFIANDLAQSGLYGNWYALSGSEIHLHQDNSQYIDLYGNVVIYGNGLIRVYGGQDESYWCTSSETTVDINTGGTFDFVDYGITIWDSNPLTYDLDGGIIRTGGNFSCYRSDFNPSGGNFEFYGGSDSYIDVYSGSNLENVVINKSGGDKSIYTYKDRDGKSQTGSKSNKIFLSSDDLDINGNLEVDAGTFDINQLTLNCYGNININNGGVLSLQDNSTLALENLSELHVNSGGTLLSNASLANDALITHISGNYDLSIENGGNISAQYTTFEYMSTEGVNLLPGSFVNVINSFNNCTFQNGQSGGRLMTVNNSESFSVNDAIFPTNTWGGTYNVYKSVNGGTVNFLDATGPFSGESFDLDPYNRIHWETPPVSYEFTVFLEGPFDPTSNKMKTDLNTILPTIQPYSPTLPYFGNATPDWYYGGSESVGAIPNIFIVDWVIVQLREGISAETATTVLASQAAFIKNTGEIVGMDGLNPLTFAVSYSSNLYAVIWHRNHLGIISANALTNIGGNVTYDFSTGSGQALGGTFAQKLLTSGTWGMISGDGDGSGSILIEDRNNVWNVQAGTVGYKAGDYNMNQHINNPDKDDNWLPNMNSGSFIPE